MGKSYLNDNAGNKMVSLVFVIEPNIVEVFKLDFTSLPG